MNFNGTRSTLQGTVNTREPSPLSGNADWTQIDGGRKLRLERQPGADHGAADGASRCISPDVVFTATAKPCSISTAKWMCLQARIVVNEVPESAVGYVSS